MRYSGKILQSGLGRRCQYGASALHAGYLGATNRHPEYVIVIAFLLQKQLH